MSYRLEPHESLPRGIKRIATEQIDQALEQLSTPPDGDRNEAVHDARKRFKKIRAVLRLVRDEIGEKVYKRENVFYRDIGRELAPVRDSYVMIETLDGLIERFAEQLPANPFCGLREYLVTTHDLVVEQFLNEEERMDSVAAALQKARLRVDRWPVNHRDFSALEGGLKRVYKRGRKRMGKSYDNPRPENFHDWRKRVKYLWYHVRILQPVWPAVFDELADELHNLSDYLGDDHDLVVLRAAITHDAREFCNETERKVLLAIIDRQRAALQAAAQPLGERIYVEKPARFVGRVASYWRAWQDD